MQVIGMAKLLIVLVPIALLILMSGCSVNVGTGADGPLFGEAAMEYLPKKCQQAPWDKWYEGGLSGLSAKPDDRTLIVAYYQQVHNAKLQDIIKHNSIALVECNACDVCRESYSFEARVGTNDVSTLIDEGWRRKRD